MVKALSTSRFNQMTHNSFSSCDYDGTNLSHYFAIGSNSFLKVTEDEKWTVEERDNKGSNFPNVVFFSHSEDNSNFRSLYLHLIYNLVPKW